MKKTNATFTYIIKKEVAAATLAQAIAGEKGRIVEAYEKTPQASPERTPAIGFEQEVTEHE